MTTIEKIREFALGLENEDEFEEARKEIAMVKREFVRRRHAEALANDHSERDVHTEHCCVRHGCKYGYDHVESKEEQDLLDSLGKHCTVVSGEKIQSHVWDKGDGCCADEYEYDDFHYGGDD